MKSFAKKAAHGICTILVLPVWAVYAFAAALCGKERAFPGWSQMMSLLPGMCGVYLRRAFYRLVLPRCDEDACINFGTIFSHPTARIGRCVYVGPFCVLGDVTLEDDVLVSSHVSIINGSRQHGIERLDVPIREQPGAWPHVTIGRDTWIGDRAVVQADVGRHCVIGSGAVVTNPIPDYAIAVGVPAKVVRDRRTEIEPAAERQPKPESETSPTA